MMRISSVGAETLLSVLDAGSMEAAARDLHISPSAVSQRLRALEEEVGRVLLVRSKPLQPTPAAAPLVRYARQLRLLEQGVARELGDDPARLRIPLAVNADSLATWFLAPLARLAERHRAVFDLHRDDQDFTARLLEEGTVMAAVTSRAEPIAGCRVRALGVLRYEAVATPRFVATHFPDGVTADALAHAPVIDFDARDDLQTRWLLASGADPAVPPRHRIPASHDFASATLRGMGWSLLPTLQTAGLAEGALLPLGGSAIDVPLFWQQWSLRSALLDAVADEVVAEARRVLIAP